MQGQSEPSRSKWSRTRKVKTIGSALIVLHLTAITLAPASVPPSSDAVRGAWSVFQPYLQAAFLNHGYHYFAPDPGPSSLIEFTLVDKDGSRHWGRIPDRDQIWPRLRYHRYFMLTEFYGGIPPSAESMKQAVAQSYAQQLMHTHDADRVELVHVVHQLSNRQEILAGGRLDDPHKYEFTPLGTFSLAAPENVEPEASADGDKPSEAAPEDDFAPAPPAEPLSPNPAS